MDEKRNSILSEALATIKLVPIPGVDAAVILGQLRRLLTEEIEVHKDTAGKYLVRDRKGLQPAAEYLRERLKSPEFAHYLQAQKQGGSGADGSRSAPPPTGQHLEPGSLEAIVAEWRNRQSTYQTMGLRPTQGFSNGNK